MPPEVMPNNRSPSAAPHYQPRSWGRYILGFWLAVSTGFAFSLSTVGDGHPAAGFIFAMILLVSLTLLFVTLGIIAILRWVLNKVSGGDGGMFLICACTSTMLVVTLGLFGGPDEPSSSFLDKIFANSHLTSPLWLLYALMIFLFLLVLFIWVTARIFRSSLPAFWEKTALPVTLVLLGTMAFLTVFTATSNQAFGRAGACTMVFGGAELKRACHIRQALTTGNVDLCQKYQLDQLLPGDCISAVAAATRNAALCDLVPAQKNGFFYQDCVVRVAILKNNKELCKGITDNDLKTNCLNPPDLDTERRKSYESWLAEPLLKRLEERITFTEPFFF